MLLLSLTKYNFDGESTIYQTDFVIETLLCFSVFSLDCPEPPPVANAYRLWKGGTPGSNVTYICVYGYNHTSGDLTRICDGTTGQYSGTEPVCTRKYIIRYILKTSSTFKSQIGTVEI